MELRCQMSNSMIWTNRPEEMLYVECDVFPHFTAEGIENDRSKFTTVTQARFTSASPGPFSTQGTQGGERELGQLARKQID